ncbi:Daunorubicin/doxorubicin resistance ATP-binding protein DrrA [bacterium HR10]|nr:Daunorubicin/doxorubicin resistance ATP-binding protein DrrA [bacterium HR10]
MAVVELHHLVKRYGHVEALRGMDLEIAEGEIFGLLGPNGAGKTTTVEILAGLRARDGGDVRVFGLDPESHRAQLITRMALQPQHFDFVENVTVREIVRLFGALYPNAPSDRVDRVLERLGLSDRLNVRFQALSGGQRQRLNIALTLIGDPQLVILDEPTTGLDPQARQQIHEFVREIRAAGKTVILTTHYLEEAEKLCDRVAIIDHGQVIACDCPRELVARFGGQTRIEFTCSDGDLSLAGLPGVTEVLREGNAWVCWSTDAGHTLEALFAMARERGVRLEQVGIRTPTLEDVFLQLTGRHFRD